MKIFQLSIDDWTGGSTYQFYHDNKTNEEFQLDVNSLLLKYGDEYIDSEENGMVDDAGWVAYVATKMGELGYGEVKVDGWYNLLQMGLINSSKEKDYEDSFKHFKSIVGEELMKKAIKKNNK
jgi:hypothetical protein